MSRTYSGAKRKRSNTPAAARRRAVEFRHARYAHKPAAQPVIRPQSFGVSADEPTVPETDTVTILTERAEKNPLEEKFAGFMAKAASLFNIVKDKIIDMIEPEENREDTAAVPEETEEAGELLKNLTDEIPSEEQAEETIREEAAPFPEEEPETAEPAVIEEETETAVLEETSAEEAETETVSEEEPAVTEETAVPEEEVPAEPAVTAEPAEETETETSVTEESAETEEPAVQEETHAEEAETETASEEEPAETAEETEVQEETPAEETETETVAEETAVTEEEPDRSLSGRWQAFRAERRRKKNAVLDAIIDTPRSNIFQMILRPGLAMTKSGSVDYPVLSQVSVCIVNIFKWGAFGTFIAMVIRSLIEVYPFSIAQMNFTKTASLAARIGVFGLAAEYFSYILISTVCGLLRRQLSLAKILDVQARSAVAVGAMFVIACVLLSRNLAVSCAVFITGAMLGLMLKGYGLDLVMKDRFSKTQQLFLTAVCIMLCVIASFAYFRFVSGDIVRIFENILNI